MPVSLARAAAFDVLLRVERDGAFASELLHSALLAKLSNADHRLATELVMGVLRWQSLLDHGLAAHSSLPLSRLDAEVLAALRLGSYQLRALERVPAHAAINESVELVKHARKRSAAAFVNAVLRKSKADSALLPAEVIDAKTPDELAERSAHPNWLVERWIRNFGFEAARQICCRDQQVPETAIRLGMAEEQELSEKGLALLPGRVLTSARIVKGTDITATLPYREGRIAIQDEASQLVAMIVGKDKAILDCCAAPGGKTRLLARRNPGARILAVELHPHRAQLLRKLVSESNVHVIAGDVKQLPVHGEFDRVLVDAPCTGTGTLSRHPEIKWRLKPEDIEDLRARQASILCAAMQHVCPGGRLVYSTCSLEPEENFEVVEAGLASAQSFALIPCQAELEVLRQAGELTYAGSRSLTDGPYLRTLPGVHPCDGFFAAILERRN